MRGPDYPNDDVPENTDGLPRISNDEIIEFMAAPPEERERRTQIALDHMKKHNKILHHVIGEVSQRMSGVVRDPVFFRTMAVVVYMFFLAQLRERMPTITRRLYQKFERQAVRPDSNTFFQEIAHMLFTENPDLNGFLISRFNKKGFTGSVQENVRHMNGAMAVYFLLRMAYLKRRWH